MPLHIIREDITRMKVDVIVAAGSATPGTPTPTGGVNGSIHKKAGSRLIEALRRLGGIKTGGATLTRAYDLPCKYVIHTAGPVWRGGSYGEETLLRACYREALQLAVRQRLSSIAFPLISTGKYGYPKAEAMQAATSEIRAFLQTHEMDVYLVVYDREAFAVSSDLFAGVQAFIDQHYVDDHYTARNTREELWADQMAAPAAAWDEPAVCDQVSSPVQRMTSDAWDVPLPEERRKAPPSVMAAPKEKAAVPVRGFELPRRRDRQPAALSLEEQLKRLDEGFSQMLLRLIDEKGMKDAACYRRANVDRKLFNKIKNTPGYTPKKSTVVAFCVALELDMRSCRELLSRAGYALSRSSIFDVIVTYYIGKGVYDVDEINQALFAYDQPLLGSNVG